MQSTVLNTIPFGPVDLPSRHRPIDQVEFGIGGQGYLELGTPGNRNAPYTTPEMDYEDWLRGEVVEQFDAENPFDILEFPDP